MIEDAHTHTNTHAWGQANFFKSQVLMSSATVLTMKCGMQNAYLHQKPNFNLIMLFSHLCVCTFFRLDIKSAMYAKYACDSKFFPLKTKL